jgi:hypothetical protein
MGVSDPSLIRHIEELVDQNIDRYVNTALVKVAMLECALRPENPKHRDLILRRLRSMNPENNPQLGDIRVQTTLLLSISNLETKPVPLQQTDLPFRKYLAYTMKSA